jgi:two-component sensor histidine kinase
LGQTADHANSVAEFEEKFRGRIASLAQSQDLITYANWQGVQFRRLVETQLAPFTEDSGVTPSIEGGDPLLSPNTALHLGLALHELAANSHNFGVLGKGLGGLLVRAAAAGASYQIEWIEEPASGALAFSASRGFGRTVLEVVVPRALRAQASYSVGPDGVRYVLNLPEPLEENTPLLRDRGRSLHFQA